MQPIKHRLFTIIAFPLLTITIVKGQTVTQATVSLNCLDSIPAWMAKHKVPVIATAIIENGKIKQTRLFGKLDNGKPVTANTLFNVASLTKPVTAIVTLILADAGQWDLDEPLYHYWVDPDLKTDPRYKKITTRILLSHQSGFPNWRSQNADKKLAFMFDPGTKYGYSGEGFEYLRHAVEAKFQRTLQQLADSVLFKPLRMRSTRYGWSSALDSTRFAEPHNDKGELILMKKVDQIIAADWLVTTIKDYAKFALSVVNQQVLSPRLFTGMVTPQVSMKAGTIESMGLGWEVMRPLQNGEYLMIHTGADDGVKTMILLFPQTKRGIILFTNGNNGFDVIKKVIKQVFQIKELTP